MSGGGYDDEPTRVLRLLAEKRAVIAERIIQGGVSPDNVAGGYRHSTGMINGLDEAREIIYEVFAGWLPDRPKPKEPTRSGDY